MRVMMFIRVLDSGGVTTHIMSLAQGLMAQGWQVAVAYTIDVGSHNHGPDWFRSNGIEVFQVPFLSNVRTIQGWTRGLEAFVKIKHICQTWRPDIIHVHYRSTSIYACFMEFSLGIPFVSTLHVSEIETGGIFSFGTFWGRRVIAISQEVRRTLIDVFKVNPNKIDLVYNGVDEEFFAPPTHEQRIQLRQKFDLKSDDFVICEIARLVEHKGHDVLLDAIYLLKQDGYQVKVLLAGTGEREAHIRQRIEILDLNSQVQLCGYQAARDVIWASDVNVLPSTVEGLPVSVIEAMLCGVPTIRTPAGGVNDQIIEGETGFVIDFGDSNSLSHNVKLLVECPDKLQLMQNACVKLSRTKFTHKIMTTQIEDVYKRSQKSSQ